MKRMMVLGWAMGALLLASPGWAQGPCLPPPVVGPNCPPPYVFPPVAPGVQQPGTPSSPGQGTTGDQTTPGATGDQTQGGAQADQQAADQQQQQQEAEAGERGPSPSYDGPIFGDLMLPTSSFSSTVNLPPQSTLTALQQNQTNQTNTAGRAFGGSGLSAAVFPYHTTFKVAENEFPKPLDRIYVTYNYYSDVIPGGIGLGGHPAEVHRQMAGGEKTFLNGNASVGVRVPIFWVFGNQQAVQAQIGDIDIIFKYALVNRKNTADAISVGLLVGVPTGPGLVVPGQSSVHPTELVPWFGEIWHWGRLYNINFTSIAVPTDSRDVTLFFVSQALAYSVYRNTDPSRWLHGIVPDIEFHANIPLNHGSLSDYPIGYPTVVDFTGGTYFFLGRSILGMAAGCPLTGPRPYGVEALVNFNILF